METINEAIDVLTIFRKGKIMPVKFKWNGRTCTVSRVTFRWVSRHGQYAVYHFSVLTGNDDVYEISLNTFDMSWNLDKSYI